MFSLHPQLEADTLPLGQFPLCTCRLMNDMHYPWVILIPQRPGIREIFQLSVKDQQQLLRESSWVAERLFRFFQADKINIGALGNMVPQLHLHHIARYQNDATWPAPVWGGVKAQHYSDNYLPKMMEQLRSAFADCQKIGFVWAEQAAPAITPVQSRLPLIDTAGAPATSDEVIPAPEQLSAHPA